METGTGKHGPICDPKYIKISYERGHVLTLALAPVLYTSRWTRARKLDSVLNAVPVL